MFGDTPVAHTTRSASIGSPGSVASVSLAVAARDLRHPRCGAHRDALRLAPASDYRAAGLVHHARQHPVRHLDHHELDPARGQRLEHDASDEARAHQHHPAARLRPGKDPACIGERPAVLDPFRIHPLDRRLDWMRAGRDQQPVVGDLGAIARDHQPVPGVDAFHPVPPHVDCELLEVRVAVTQMGAGLADVLGEKVGKRHARVRWFRLVAEDDDVARRVDSAQRFRRDDAGRPGADNDVSHGFIRSRFQPKVAEARLSGLPCLSDLIAAPDCTSFSTHTRRRLSVSLVGTPSSVQPRSR